MGQCMSKSPACAAANRRGDSLSISSSFGGDEECSLYSAQGPRQPDDQDKIFQSTSRKKKVRGEYRPILIKSGQQESSSTSSPLPSSSTSKGRRVQFFISPSKSDMKKSDIKPKKVAPEVSVEFKLESQRIRKNSPKKGKKCSSSSKKQNIVPPCASFVEPEIENSSPPSKPLRIFTHTPTTSSCSPSSQRKPLLSINITSTQNTTTTDEITDKRKVINVSKLPLFKFAKSNNSKKKNVLKNKIEGTTTTTTTNTHAHNTASEIIITLQEPSTHNLTGTTINRTKTTKLNGNDNFSTLVDSTKTTTTTMGVNFSDDTTKTATLPQHLLGHAERDNTNCNIQTTSAIFKTQKTILNESINSSSLSFIKPNYSANTTNKNNLNSNLNDVTNLYSQHLSSTPDQVSTSIKSAEKIIAENRLRRNLFFGSPDIQTDLTNGNININNYTVDNMNAYPKNSIFKNPHDMTTKQKLQQQQQQEATMPVPKLYSLNHHTNGMTTVSNTMRGEGSKTVDKTQSTMGSTSKLPTYSGAYNNNSRLPNACATTTKISSSSSLFNSRIQNVLPNKKSQHLRGSQNQIDLPQPDPKVSQWISANDFFKQNPISKYPSGSVGIKSQQQQHQEARRETLPSRFGYTGPSLTQRKKFSEPSGQPSNDVLDRRASAYVSTTTSNAGRKIPVVASGLKKPIQSKPFYEIMMHRNVQPSGTVSSTINNTTKNPSSTFGSAGLFQGVSTGRVRQAASNIEKKIHDSVVVTSQNSEESVHHNTTISASSNSPQSSNNSSSLLRSNTWVKSSPTVYIPTDSIIDNNTTTTTENVDDENSLDRTIIQNASESITRGTNASNISSSSSRLQKQKQHQQLNTSSPSCLQGRKSFTSGIPCQPKAPRLSLSGLASQKRDELEEEETFQNIICQSDKIIEGRKELILPHESNNSNYPLTTSSTSSSVISSEEPTSMSSSHLAGGGGGTDNDKAISELGELIDDEIEDQPDLTLTFKDSSLILSPSSSGESLVSCDLMLDYKDSTCSAFGNSGDSALLDLEEPSIMPPNRNKSVISSIVSTDVLCTSSGVPQRIMVNSNTRRSSGNQGFVSGRNGHISPVATSTPVNISTNNSNKASSGLTSNKFSQNSYISHRDKITQNNNNTVSRQQQSSQNSLQNNRHGGSRGKLTSIPSPIHNSHDVSSSSSSSLSSSKMSTSSETPIVPSSIPTKIKTQNISNTNSSINNNSNNNSNLIKSPYRYPRNSSPARIPTLSTSPNKSSGIIRKNNNTSINNEVNITTPTRVINKSSEGESFESDSFVKEILTEVLECKNQLEELKTVLETTEKEVMDKNEIIERQKKEIEYWKNTALSTNVHSSSHNKDINITRDDDGDYWGKEKGLINMVKETSNACSQTENTYQPKPAVSYPDENDKMGQLVSFRIGRMSSNTSNKS